MIFFQFVAAPGGDSQDSAGDAEKGCERTDQGGIQKRCALADYFLA